MKIECYFDGATEPTTPGGAMGMGAIIIVDGEVKLSHSEFVPADRGNTNNIAEYRSFEVILDFLIANEMQDKDVTIRGDSKLVIEQMNFNWAIKQGAYVPYAERCKQKILKHFANHKIEWIPRHLNERADELSKSELVKHNIKITVRQ